VALIVAATLLARGAEGLAWATTCPNRSVIGPACKSQGEGPSADAGKEVALGVASKVVRSDIGDASFVNVAGRNVASGN
jgi:hypothetical protein